tara:strand:- start:260 stop:553 length:294 start_codon:yes stop_codon:yes gene_type:complete
MNDLQAYHEIKTLKKEVARLTLRNVEWKHKYKKLCEKHGHRRPTSRGDKALITIEKIKLEGFTGTVISQLKLVADKHFLSVGHINDLWYKSNNKVTT